MEHKYNRAGVERMHADWATPSRQRLLLHPEVVPTNEWVVWASQVLDDGGGQQLALLAKDELANERIEFPTLLRALIKVPNVWEDQYGAILTTSIINSLLEARWFANPLMMAAIDMYSSHLDSMGHWPAQRKFPGYESTQLILCDLLVSLANATPSEREKSLQFFSDAVLSYVVLKLMRGPPDDDCIKAAELASDFYPVTAKVASVLPAIRMQAQMDEEMEADQYLM